MAYLHEFEKLQLTDPTGATVPHVALGHPSPLEEQALGQIGVLLILSGTESLRHEIAVMVGETLKDRYYHGDVATPEAAFEAALAEVNRKLHQLIADGVTGWLPTFGGAAFAVKGDQLILSIVGSVVAQLFRGPQITDLGSTPGAERTVNPLKVFASVLVGRVAPGDTVLLASPTVLDYYSLEKLKRLVLVEAPGEALAAVERQLAPEARDGRSFGALLLTVRDVAAPHPVALGAPSAMQPAGSMDRLIAQEQRTSSFLSPSFWSAARQFAGNAVRSGGDAFRTFILKKPPRRRLHGAETERETALPRRTTRGPSGRTLGHNAGSVLRGIGRALSAIGLLLLRGVAAGIRAVRRTPPPDPVMVRDHLSNLPRRTERRANRMVLRILSWPRSQQLLALVALVLLVVFAQSVLSLGGNRRVKLTKPQQQTILTSAREKVDAATAALTYGDEHSASQDLADAAAAIGRLPKHPSVDNKALAKLRTDLAAGFDRTQHRTRVDKPTVVVDLASQATQKPTVLLSVGTTLIAGEVAPGRMARYDRPKATVTVTDIGVPDAGTVRAAAPEGTTGGLLLTDRNALLRYAAKDGSVTPVPLDLPTGSTAVGIATFESRLYVLDAGRNQIVRFTRVGPAYSARTDWLADPAADVHAAAAITVDGSVYVTSANGLDLYFQGKRGSLTLTPLSPPLKNPTRVWTSATAKHLYILDPLNHRVAVFDKTGALVQQILFPDSMSPTDLTANESNKELLVLSDTKIVRVDLSI